MESIERRSALVHLSSAPQAADARASWGDPLAIARWGLEAWSDAFWTTVDATIRAARIAGDSARVALEGGHALTGALLVPAASPRAVPRTRVAEGVLAPEGLSTAARVLAITSVDAVAPAVGPAVEEVAPTTEDAAPAMHASSSASRRGRKGRRR